MSQLSPEWDGTEGDCPTELAAMGDVNEKNVAVNEGDEIEAGCYIDKNINIHGDAEFESSCCAAGKCGEESS